ncbi:mitochondrial carrier domain-containing protein [Truncatella angustata]|uniref:Mitochondrial carrier domain-containing protein n=1 Tax=Truncatella angustata TaxID=152316 RepID=A0A9P9A2Y7_9PEZI|nr:mitochondrial carrier domain-containing protein [Truncatella angustata]KAH6658701.1 mitochondrial carrier domain-containing protein [Truncatella angustata]
MTTPTRDGVNPLRPYYIPPTIGEQTESIPRQPNPFSHASATAGASNSTKYASRARDIFPDLDYRDYVNDPSPSTIQSVKELIDELLWKYTSVLMAQPFEVAKTVLQVRTQDDIELLETGTSSSSSSQPASRPKIPSPRESMYEQYPESDSDDEPSYFTSNAPYQTPTPSTRSHRRRSSPTDSPKPARAPDLLPHQLNLKRPDSVLEVISQLWSKESAWGVWKGSNATFLYTVLQSLLENWSRSLLSALLNVPDLGVKDDVDRLVDIASPYPWASLCVAATAAVATGLVLAPLDVVRTRLLLTSTNNSKRRTMSALRSLPSWLCPSSLVAPTILHSLVHPLITLSTPLVLRSQFLIDKQLSPTTFSVAKFCTSCVSLFVKLPLETVLRRGQASVFTQPAYVRALDKSGGPDTIVHAGSYNGVVGTMYTIIAEEGSRVLPLPAKAVSAAKNKKGKPAKIGETVYKRGQGVGGLWRGWKVSWWGLVGLWTAGVVGGGGEGEF